MTVFIYQVKYHYNVVENKFILSSFENEAKQYKLQKIQFLHIWQTD